jgi:hypothetical protein
MAILRASVLFLDGPGRREVAGSHVQRRRHCIWPLQQKKARLTGPFISAEIRPPLFREHVRDHFVRRVNDHELVVNREIIWFSEGLLAVTLLGIGSIVTVFGTKVPIVATKPAAF